MADDAVTTAPAKAPISRSKSHARALLSLGVGSEVLKTRWISQRHSLGCAPLLALTSTGGRCTQKREHGCYSAVNLLLFRKTEFGKDGIPMFFHRRLGD